MNAVGERMSAAGERTIDDSELEELYKEEILELYKHPLNKHSLSHYTIKRDGLNPLCGDRITIYLDVEDNIIKNVSFEGDGCAISQAAASLLTEKIKRMAVPEVMSFSAEKMMGLLGIHISHLRRKCALLALQTVQHGLGSEQKVEQC